MARRRRHHKSAADRARRRARLKRLLHVLAWLDPIGAIYMASKLIAEKVKEKKAAKKLSKQEESIIDQLNNSIQDITSQQNPPSANGASVDAVADKITDEEPDGASNDTGGGSASASSGVGLPAIFQPAFDTANKQANALSGQAKTDTLANILDIQNDVIGQQKQAQTELATSDKSEVAQAKDALKGNEGSVGKSANASELKSKGKKSALASIPTWGYAVVAAATVLGVLYLIFGDSSQQQNIQTNA